MRSKTLWSNTVKADESLRFNLSWHIGWAVGVAQGLKAQGLDIPQSISCLAAIFNEVKHADKISWEVSEMAKDSSITAPYSVSILG